MKIKKGLGALALGCGVLFLTGCGGNKVVCTMDASDEFGDDAKGDVKVTANFNKDWDEVTSMDMKVVLELDDEEMAEQIKKYFDSSCDDDDAPEDCKVKISGKKVTFTASQDGSELFGGFDEETKEGVIEEMESSGFSCK